MNVLGRFAAVLAVPMVLHGFYHVDDLLGGWGTSWFAPLNGCVGDPACHALLNVPGYVTLAALAVLAGQPRRRERAEVPVMGRGRARSDYPQTSSAKRGDLCAFGACRIRRLQGSPWCYRHELASRPGGDTHMATLKEALDRFLGPSKGANPGPSKGTSPYGLPPPEQAPVWAERRAKEDADWRKAQAAEYAAKHGTETDQQFRDRTGFKRGKSPYGLK